MKLRDRLWIWGQEPDSHGGTSYNIPLGNTVTPVEGAGSLGIPNCCRVVMHGRPEPPFDRESELMRDMKQVVWSVMGDGGSTRNNNGGDDAGEVIRQARKYGNITGGIMDDFFLASGPRVTHERMKEIRAMFQAEKLKLWLVSYDLDWRDLSDNKDYFDVITFWTWDGTQNHLIEERMRRLRSMLSPGQEAVAGCYLWNYHQKRPLTRDEMQVQCDAFHRLLREKVISGVVICSNTVLGLGIEAERMIREWINAVGDEEL